ncbi:hypothetical protein DSECCO2_372950 [anaerobic digester metagenome]
MLEVGEAVDHRDGCMGRKLLDRSVGVGPDHHSRDVPGEDAGRVGDRLPPAQLHIPLVEVQGVAAELEHPDLERDPGTR